MAADLDPGPGPTEVRAAARRIASRVRHTPLERSEWLSARTGVPIHLKLECWQRTGSFKLRGAANAIATVPPGPRADGLVTASAGNHGLALACAASAAGVPLTVFVPASAPEIKTRRIRRYGATLREVEGTYDDAAAAARAHAASSDAHFVHPFDDPAVVAGQGTIALEIMEDCPETTTVVVPVGGGGLLAGVGIGLRDSGAGPEGVGGRGPPRVIGVQSSATRAMHAAFAAGGVVPVPEEATLCDGLAGETEPGAYERARAVTDRIQLVEEAAVGPAIAALYREEGIVAEGSAAVVVAAVLAGSLPLDGPAALVISGGNIDPGRLAGVLSEHG